MSYPPSIPSRAEPPVLYHEPATPHSRVPPDGSATTNPHGLATTHNADSAPVFLPLRSVSVHANIVDVSARVELKQVYSNTSKLKNATAQYIFPVPANAAVCAFQMKSVNGRSIQAVVKKLDEARAEYEDAIANDQWAGLLQQLTGDVFCLSVGAIPAKQDITVSITYVQELAQDELVNQVRFYLPTYVAERYGDPPAQLKRRSSDTKVAWLDISIDVQMASRIERIVSPSHRNDVRYTQVAHSTTGGPSVYTSSVTFKSNAAARRLDRDFVLAVQAAGLGKPRCVAEVDRKRNSVAMSLSLVPNFGAEELSAQEYVFIIDRSGSMAGEDRIMQAKEAMQILLKSLPSDNTYFNVVGFGSSYSVLWNGSQAYNYRNLKTATEHVDGIDGDMGGTEIEGALRYVFGQRKTDIPTSVIILTDGGVWDTGSVLQIVQLAVSQSGPISDGNHLRVFTLGIGQGASTALCEGIARAGNGICYMTTQSEQIAKHCANLLQAARSPPIASLYDISIDWGCDRYTLPSASLGKGKARQRDQHAFSASRGSASPSDFELPDLKPVQQAPSTIPELFLQNRYIISAILSGTTSVPSTVLIKGNIPGGSEFTLPIPVHEAKSTPLLHTLAARRLITELEDGEISCTGLNDGGDVSIREAIAKAAVEKFSVEYQLVSSQAAFVVVENESDDDDDDSLDGDSNALAKADSLTSLDEPPTPVRPDNDPNTVAHTDIVNLPTATVGDSPSRGLVAHNHDAIASVSGNCGSPPNPCGNSSQPIAPVATQAPGDTGRTPSPEIEKSTPSRASTRPDQVNGVTSTRVKSRTNKMTDETEKLMPGAWPGEKDRSPCTSGKSKRSSAWKRNGKRLYKVMTEAALRIAQFGAYCNLEAIGQVVAHVGMAGTMRLEPTRANDPLSRGQHNPPLLHAAVELFYEAPMPMVRVVKRKAPKPPPARVAVLSRVNPIAPIARLQSFEGSFALDSSLVGMLALDKAGANLQMLKDGIPGSIKSSPQAETIWATVLAIAHLKSTMSHEKDVWNGMWQKAMRYVMQTTAMDPAGFSQLVDEAQACIESSPSQPEIPLCAYVGDDVRTPRMIYVSDD